MDLVWMCFSDLDGNNSFPGFNILDQKLAEKAKLHFDNLWKNSEKEILLEIRSSNHSTPNKDIFQSLQ